MSSELDGTKTLGSLRDAFVRIPLFVFIFSNAVHVARLLAQPMYFFSKSYHALHYCNNLARGMILWCLSTTCLTRHGVCLAGRQVYGKCALSIHGTAS